VENTMHALAASLGNQLKSRGWQLALAESCTGGAIAQAVTDIAGSSAWFDRGFVTYSNAAKMEMLGVKHATLESVGAVSQEAALEMVAGALVNSHADIAIAVTGIAGPEGGTLEKPVGTVFIAWQCRGQAAYWIKQCFMGDRQAVRRQVVEFSLRQLAKLALEGAD
jgi:nicotinamide-nucleotide amidase